MTLYKSLSAGKGITVHLYKDGTTSPYEVIFKLPFILKDHTQYVYWYQIFIQQIREVYGDPTATYINTYFHKKEDARGSISDLQPPERRPVNGYAEHIAQRVKMFGIDQSILSGIKVSSQSLDTLCNLHETMTKYTPRQFKDLIHEVAQVLVSFGAYNELDFMDVYRMCVAHSFSGKELFYLLALGNPDNDDELIIKSLFRSMNVDNYDFREKLFKSCGESACPTNELVLAYEGQNPSKREKVTALKKDLNSATSFIPSTVNSSVNLVRTCTHCSKQGHTEDRCFLKHPELRTEANKRKKKAHWTEIKNKKRAKAKKDKSQQEKPKGEETAKSFLVSPHSSKSSGSKMCFIWDSGSPIHFVSDLTLLSGYVKCPKFFGDYGTHHYLAPGYGRVTGRTISGKVITMANVYYIPDASANVISAYHDFGLSVSKYRSDLFDSDGVKIGEGRSPGHYMIDLDCKVHDNPGVTLSHSEIKAAHDDMKINLVNVYALRSVRWETKATYAEKDMEHHIRAGHPTYQQYLELQKKFSFLPNIDKDIREHCDACQQGTMVNFRKDRESETIATHPLEYLHADICGPISPAGFDGSKFCLVVVDKFTRMYYCSPMTRKEDTLGNFYAILKRLVDEFPGEKFRQVRVDNGGEFRSKMYSRGHKDIFDHFNISLKFTTPYSSHQNGLAERAIRAISTKARVLLLQSGLPLTFWPEAFKTAVFTLNNSPKSQNHWIIPMSYLSPRKYERFELWEASPFGCLGYFKKYKVNAGKKVDPRGGKCISLGPALNRKATRVIVLDNDKLTEQIVETHQVKFISKKFPFLGVHWTVDHDSMKSHIMSESHPNHFCGDPEEEDDSMLSPDYVPVDQTDESVVSNQQEKSTEPHGGFTSLNKTSEEDVSNMSDKDSGDRSENELSHSVLNNGASHPQSERSGTVESPRAVPEQDNINRRATEDESQHSPRMSSRLAGKHKLNYRQLSGKRDNRVHSLRGGDIMILSVTPGDDYVSKSLASFVEAFERNNVTRIMFTKVRFEPETYKEAISCDEADKWKTAIDSELDSLREKETFEETTLPSGRKPIEYKWIFTIKDGGRYKARLVAKGFSQVPGKDYQETYSPVAKYDTIKLSIALAANLGMTVHQIDVKTAFLNGPLGLDLYLTVPEGLQTSQNKGKVLRLKRALYGLKQAPLVWNLEVSKTLRSIGLVPCVREPCLYYLYESGVLLLVALYVDDMLIMSSDIKLIEKVKQGLSMAYEIKDLGPAKKFLGMNVSQSDSVITLSLEDYISKLISLHLDQSSQPCETPYYSEWSDLLCPLVTDELYPNPTKFREIIGKLLFACTTVRYDISFITIALARYSSKPAMKHYKACMRILRYLKGTSDFAIRYRKVSKPKRYVDIKSYSDADWANCKETFKSVSGNIFFIEESPVIWKSKKQTSVALSSLEAEYYALCECVRSANWLKFLLTELRLWNLQRWIITYVDNQGCKDVCDQEHFTSDRTKHFKIRLSYINDEVKKANVKVLKVHTKNNFADLMTKGLKQTDFKRLRNTQEESIL
ncbi:hypothetical protein FT663_05492 [Candidozyma haemuli var. vulneris]|nr:hypothetical protein FT663_05492 [[Candida] haemuloni var. vulneris]